MAEFKTLITDVQKLFDGHDLSETAQVFSDKLGIMVVDRLKRNDKERQPKLYLSNVGKPLRQLWYELTGYKGEPLSSETKTKFLYGSIIEELFIFLAIEAGHKVTDLQKRIEYDGVSGKIDCIIDDVLVDVKSCSTRSFEKFENGSLLHNDPFGYVAQLTGYANALGVERAAFIAIDKVTGKICIFELTNEMRKKYDLSKRIATVREALQGGSPPARCFEPVPISKKDKSGNLVLGTTCSYCAFKKECHKDSNEGKGLQIRFYSSGPKFFTKILREPRLKSNQEDFEEFKIKDAI